MSRSLLAFFVLACAQLASVGVPAQEDGSVDILDDEADTFDRTPRNCIALNLVRRTEVIDDRTILFHLRTGEVLRNSLPRDCPNLERDDRFEYQTRTRQLCRIDTITVLPLGFGIGATCRLGSFHPLSPEDLEELKDGPSPVETVEPEPSAR
jgi:hypothetical protein